MTGLDARSCFAIFSALLLCSCASTTNVVEKPNAKLLRETVNVKWDNSVQGVVSSGGNRTVVGSSSEDCERGSGTLLLNGSRGGAHTKLLGSSDQMNDVNAGGDRPQDKVFAQLCAARKEIVAERQPCIDSVHRSDPSADPELVALACAGPRHGSSGRE